jgi:hypothetical protein
MTVLLVLTALLLVLLDRVDGMMLANKLLSLGLARSGKEGQMLVVPTTTAELSAAMQEKLARPASLSDTRIKLINKEAESLYSNGNLYDAARYYEAVRHLASGVLSGVPSTNDTDTVEKSISLQIRLSLKIIDCLTKLEYWVEAVSICDFVLAGCQEQLQGLHNNDSSRKDKRLFHLAVTKATLIKNIAHREAEYLQLDVPRYGENNNTSHSFSGGATLCWYPNKMTAFDVSRSDNLLSVLSEVDLVSRRRSNTATSSDLPKRQESSAKGEGLGFASIMGQLNPLLFGLSPDNIDLILSIADSGRFAYDQYSRMWTLVKSNSETITVGAALGYVMYALLSHE